MSEEEKAKKSDRMNLDVGYMPEGHVVVGYIAYIKVLDKNGEAYWASRNKDLNMMEQLGMALDQFEETKADVNRTRIDQSDD